MYNDIYNLDNQHYIQLGIEDFIYTLHLLKKTKSHFDIMYTQMSS